MHHRKQVAITSDLAVPEYTLQHESTFKHSQRLTISDGHQRIVAHATKPDGPASVGHCRRKPHQNPGRSSGWVCNWRVFPALLVSNSQRPASGH